MIIASLVIMLVVIAACIHYTFEALQVNDYKNCKEHYKIIKTLVENRQDNN